MKHHMNHPQERGTAGACNNGIEHRKFLQLTGAGSLAWLASRMPVMAGPFEAADFQKLVPADKKLRPRG